MVIIGISEREISAMNSTKNLLIPCLAFTVLGALAFPCLSAAPKPTPPLVADLSTQVIKHGAECPLPSKGPCVIKKPVGTRYRVLTSGVSLEDMGDYWVADFSKTKDPKKNRESLRILGANGELHEIDVLFPKEPVVKEKPAVKETPVVKVEPVAKPVEPVKEEAK
jgi:hypothetical protein